MVTCWLLAQEVVSRDATSWFKSVTVHSHSQTPRALHASGMHGIFNTLITTAVVQPHMPSLSSVGRACKPGAHHPQEHSLLLYSASVAAHMCPGGAQHDRLFTTLPSAVKPMHILRLPYMRQGNVYRPTQQGQYHGYPVKTPETAVHGQRVNNYIAGGHQPQDALVHFKDPIISLPGCQWQINQH